MGGDDAVADGKAETGAFAAGFSREEWIKDTIQIFGRNATAVIGDFDDDFMFSATGYDFDFARAVVASLVNRGLTRARLCSLSTTIWLA